MTTGRAPFPRLVIGVGLALSLGCGPEPPRAPTDPGFEWHPDAPIRPEAPRATRQEMAALRVEAFDVRLLGEGTQLGRRGDLLLTFFGSGFLGTSRNPRAVVADTVVLEQTEISGSGEALFVVLPQEVAAATPNLGGRTIAVWNPSSGAETPPLEIPATGLEPDPGVPPVRVVYRESGPVREDAPE
ncbi:MAG: hypothetical protein ABFS41_05385 [Myxococcota bacterium]